MTFSPSMNSGVTGAKNRSKYISPQSGMCSLCTEECPGPCEITQAAVLGKRTVYPTTTGPNQIGSEKDYPIDFSHFNINGRAFGALGTEADYEHAEIFNVNLACEYGSDNKVKLDLPIVLPALVKMNWLDYFGGAAMAGVSCMIGEDARNKDPELTIENGKITSFPMLQEIHDSFYNYHRGPGQMVLQCNVDDHLMGVPDIALNKYGFEALEFKFGQGAKGTQPMNRIKDYDEAVKKVERGSLVFPNPLDPKVIELREKGCCPNFYTYGRLPMWTEESMAQKISELRAMGMKNVYFKMAGFDPIDVERVINIAIENRVDMITFDGAGGGSGYSPAKMMNEWSLPTVMLEQEVVDICSKLQDQSKDLPAMVMTGGLISEDHLFKSLAYGDGFISAIGVCRGAMAAAMTGKNVGDAIKAGKTPELFKKFGNTIDEVFCDLADLRGMYGKEADNFSTGAIGVFSYLNKLGCGLRHFAALNRKFDVKYLDRSDLIPLTYYAQDLMD